MDYYQTLGVTKEAEDFVIKAAYKALMRAYHPDRNPGFEERVKLINQAYEVLSNPRSRASYDAEQADAVDESTFEDSPFSNDIDNDLLTDWKVIADYYPEIEECRLELTQYASTLATSFVLEILEKRNFDNFEYVARSLKDKFLSSYFGSNTRIQRVAEELLLRKQKDALLEINKAIKVMGDSADPDRVIIKVKERYPNAFIDIQSEGIDAVELMQELVAKTRIGDMEVKDLNLLALRLGCESQIR